MRHVIYLLLVANLVFFGWQMLQLQKQDGMVRALPAIPATASTLVTLQEIEQQQEPVSGIEQEPGQQGMEQWQEPVSGFEQEEEPEPGLQEIEQWQEPVSGFEPEPEPGLQEIEQWQEPVSGPEPGPGLQEPLEQLDLVESLTMQQPPGGGGAITCRTLGPIMVVAQLKALSSRLDEMGLEPRHRTSEKQEAKGYWVYLPAMKYSDAREIKRKLDKRKDKEYYIGRDNFISLGTFREKSRADVRKRQVRKLGLEALLEPRYEIQTAHWLDTDRKTSNAIDLGAVMEDFPGIRLQEQACY